MSVTINATKFQPLALLAEPVCIDGSGDCADAGSTATCLRFKGITTSGATSETARVLRTLIDLPAACPRFENGRLNYLQDSAMTCVATPGAHQ